MTYQELAHFNGIDKHEIYLSVKHNIFNVTNGSIFNFINTIFSKLFSCI